MKNGTRVCIKVQKPGVDVTLLADLNFLLVVAKVLEFVNPSLSQVSLADIVSDIKDSMVEEIDFRKEAQNLVNFNEFLDRNAITDAVAPRPYLQLTTPRLLTMEFLQGTFHYRNFDLLSLLSPLSLPSSALSPR